MLKSFNVPEESLLCAWENNHPANSKSGFSGGVARAPWGNYFAPSAWRFVEVRGEKTRVPGALGPASRRLEYVESGPSLNCGDLT